jgi:hypothetical protein
MPIATDGLLLAGGLMLATAAGALACSVAAGSLARLRHEARFGARQEALWRHILRRTEEIVRGASGLHRLDVERLAMAALEPLIAMHVALADFMPEADQRAVETFLLGVTRRNLSAELDRRETAAPTQDLVGAT